MSDPTTVTSPSLFSNKNYDRAKFFATVVLPALGALYAALALIWGFPASEEVVGSIAAVNAFLGIVLKVSNNNFVKTYDGEVRYGPGIEPGDTAVAFNMDPKALPHSDIMTFKVIHPDDTVVEDSQDNHVL